MENASTRRCTVSFRPSFFPAFRLSFPDGALLPERHPHHFRPHTLAPALDFELRAGLREGGGDVGGTDPDSQGGAHRTASDQVRLAAIAVDRVSVAGNAAAFHLEAHEAAGDATLLL